jgi:hypothetical protein
MRNRSVLANARAYDRWKTRHPKQAKKKIQRGKVEKPKHYYTIPAGTLCHVRPINSKGKWLAHRTREQIVCSGFLWRTTTVLRIEGMKSR